MGKMGKGLVAVVALAAAAWVGGWFFVKGKIPQAVAQQTAALKAHGLDVTHGPVTVTGFPFKHNARIENLVVSSTQEQFGRKVAATTTIPWIEGSWAMFSPSKGQITGMAETSKIDLTLDDRRFSGDLKIVNLRGSADGSDSAAAAYDLAADSLGATLTGALTDAQKLVPGPKDFSVAAGPLTLKGTTGAAMDLESVLSNFSATTRSAMPNPAFGEEGLVDSVATIGFSSLTSKTSRQGGTQRGEILLPALTDLKIKTGDRPEIALPVKSTNARLSFVDGPEKIDFTLVGDALSYTMTQTEGPITVSSDAGYGKFEFKGSADKATFAQFDAAKLEAGVLPDFSKVDARFEYKAADSYVAMKSTPNEAAEADPFNSMPPVPAFNLDVKSGANSGVVGLQKGVFDISASSAANVFAFSGPAEVSGDVGDLVVNLKGPLLAAEAPQPFVFEYDFDKVNLNEGAWDLIDPTGALDRQVNRLRIAFSGDVVVNASLGDQEALEAAMAAGKAPFFPSRVKIEDVTVDALGLVAKASGEAALDPANPSAPPRGEGLVSLKNWSPFLTSLVNAGFAPPDASAMAEGMIGMLGEENEAGETVFRIAAGEDGVLTVNDNPMAELPGLVGAAPSAEEEWPFEEDLPLDEELNGVEEQELAPLDAPEAQTPAVAPPAPAPLEAAPALPAPAAPEGETEGSLERLQQNLEEGAHQLHQEAEQGIQRLEEGVREGVEGIQESLPSGERILQDAEGGLQQLQQGVEEMREGLPSVDQLRQDAEEGVQHLREGVEEGVQQLQEQAPSLEEIQRGAEEGAQHLREGVEGGLRNLGDEAERLRQELAPTAPAAPAPTQP